MTAVVFDTLAIETLHNGTDGLAGVLADNVGLGTASNGAAVFLVWLAWKMCIRDRRKNDHTERLSVIKEKYQMQKTIRIGTRKSRCV